MIRSLTSFLQGPLGIAVFKGPQHTIHLANNVMLKYWKKNAEQVLQKPATQALLEGDPVFLSRLQQCYNSGEMMCYQDEAPSASATIYFISLEDKKDQSRFVTVLLYNAIEKPYKPDEQFIRLGNLLPHPIWLAAPDGSLYYLNKRVYEFTGLHVNELNPGNWLSIVHPDDREENMKVWMEAVSTGNEFLFEHRFKRYDGTYRWHISHAKPQKNAEGAIEIWVGTTTDIHDQWMFANHMEEMVKERTRELERKNMELEQFAFAASHDMQEPLRKIQVFISMLLENENTFTAPQKTLLHKIDKSAFRLKNMINDMLAFATAQGNHEDFQKQDLNEVLLQVQTDLELMLVQKKARIIYDSLPVVMAMPGQMHQLFYNLIHNSLKFADDQRNPEIRISIQHDPMWISILFSDNGIGFEQENAERIFHLFQRLNRQEAYEGTGIGLTMCKKIVDVHKGEIIASSRPGKGTAFKIRLPLSMLASFPEQPLQVKA